MPIGHVTECSGVPGSGKTQLWLVFDLLVWVKCSCFFLLCVFTSVIFHIHSMQLAVAVQVPEIIGGLQGEAIYIDAEGSFTVERLTEMAAAAAQHCQSICEGV